MTRKLATLKAAPEKALGNRVQSLTKSIGELTLVVKAVDYYDIIRTLHNDASPKFEQLIDLRGVDYADYGDNVWNGPHFATVSHLPSVTHNWCVRIRTFTLNNDLPVVASVTMTWSSIDWYKREAFDLYGLVFEGHLDLRRILIDHGFISHPFRKDLPASGYVEICYDPAQRRAIYQPVTIESRKIIPHVIHED